MCKKYCRVFITIYCVDCCVYYSLLLVIRSAIAWLINEGMKLKFVILEVGNSRGDMVGGSRRVVAWVLNGALLLEMIRYKLAWWLFIYQRLLCVKFVMSMSYLSKQEDIV